MISSIIPEFFHPSIAFLGNHFLQVLGENFSAHSVSNPDQASERRILEQLAPELSQDMILRLVGVFHDLRKGYDSGVLSYPYSLRGAQMCFTSCAVEQLTIAIQN